jgi:hypothetical protein
VPRRKFKPGQQVPVSGIYRVEHDSHRLMHEAALLEKGLFPRCRKCNSQVRFQLVRPMIADCILPFRSSAILEEFKINRLHLVKAG